MFNVILRKLRKENNLTQKELGYKIGCTQSMIAQWEMDMCEPTETYIKRLAVFFDITSDELLGIETKSEKEQIKMQINKSVIVNNNSNITIN